MLSFSDWSNKACSLKIHGLQNYLGYVEQILGFKSITKSIPCYAETFHTWAPPRKYIITYSVASSPQNHNIKMAGGSLRKIRVKVFIIKGQEYRIHACSYTFIFAARPGLVIYLKLVTLHRKVFCFPK
jgi:hypothetical protein